MDNENRINKDVLMSSIDTELAEKEENTPFGNRNSEYFNRLEIMTYLRNAILTAPISDHTAKLLMQQAPHVLRSMYDYWEDTDFPWGSYDYEKVENTADLLWEYTNALEQIDNGLRLNERSLLFSDVKLVSDEGKMIEFPAGGIIDTHNINFLDGYQDFTSELPAGSEITATVNSWSVGIGEGEFATDGESALIENYRQFLEIRYGMDHLQTAHFTEQIPEDGLDFDDEEADDELEL